MKYIKAGLVTLWLLCAHICFAQGVVIDHRPLTWNDFRGKAEKGSVKAKTYTYMGYESKVKNKKFSYKVTCYFNPKLSWVSKEYLRQCTKAQSAHLLKHEQGHYDIARIIAAEADNELGALRYRDKRTIQKAKNIFNKYVKKLKAVQQAYDRDTKHSLVSKEQTRWNDKIEKALKKGRIDL